MDVIGLCQLDTCMGTTLFILTIIPQIRWFKDHIAKSVNFFYKKSMLNKKIYYEKGCYNIDQY